MEQTIHLILTKLFIIVEYEETIGSKKVKQHKLNVWNPLAWLCVVCVSIIVGIIEACKFCVVVVKGR